VSVRVLSNFGSEKNRFAYDITLQVMSPRLNRILLSRILQVAEKTFARHPLREEATERESGHGIGFAVLA
jgi:hypothetical protein